jgi:predicted unusual protein kinase regulating ubiquinone biosynthesis (AarF/ABC1/UbiB family)
MKSTATTNSNNNEPSNLLSWTSIAALRSARVLEAALEILYDYQTTFSKFKHLSPSEKGQDEGYLKAKSECHQRSSEKMLEVFRKNGGVYIKLVGTLAFFFSPFDRTVRLLF